MQRLIIILVGCMLCFGACNDFGDKVLPIWVSNKTSMPIYCIYSRMYPDTSLPEKRNDLRYAKAMDDVHFELSDRNYNELFEGLPKDTLSIFIVSPDTLLKYNWDQMRSGYKILKRYDVSRHDLDTGHNTITYP